MTTIDFGGVLAAAAYPNGGRDGAGRGMATIDAILAAVVPDLCHDCHGSGLTYANVDGTRLRICTHLNAPTIGQMLREWQALTALAEYAMHRGQCACVGWNPRDTFKRPTCTCGLDAARAALEAVRS